MRVSDESIHTPAATVPTASSSTRAIAMRTRRRSRWGFFLPAVGVAAGPGRSAAAGVGVAVGPVVEAVAATRDAPATR